MRPAKRGSDLSKSTVCRMAEAPGSPFGPALLTRRQEGAILAAFICSLGLEFPLMGGASLVGLVRSLPDNSTANPGLPKRLAARTRRSQRPQRIGQSLERWCCSRKFEDTNVARSSEKAPSLFCRMLPKAGRFLRIKIVTCFKSPGLLALARLEKAPI